MEASREQSSVDSQEALIGARLAALRTRIDAAARRSGRTGADVRVVAVTKTVAPERICAALAAGLEHLGENRVQEALFHQASVGSDCPQTAAQWHMIGHLQRNKAKQVAASFDRLDSLDSERLAVALSSRLASLGRELPVLLEVNVSGETSKHGFPAQEDALLASAKEIAQLPGLRIEGLMTIGPLHAQAAQVRAAFRQLAALRAAMRDALPEQRWSVLSMGMSGDFEMAIEEGATEVRLGSALFGVRDTRLAEAGLSGRD
jgi:pyridoxal phosphate enzyme (YggS family)